MLASVRLLNAFLLRDFLKEASYRLAFAFSLTNIVFGTLSFYFISQLIGGSGTPGLAQYGGDYFPFVLIGIALNGYFSLGLSGFGSALREAQTTGTLEAMMMSPAPLSLIVTGSALYSYAFTTVRVIIYLMFGMLLGARFPDANLVGALLILLLSIIAFASIGILAASFIMVIKRGDPVTGLFASLSSILGGVWYPIEILPEWLQPFSLLIPITYALRGMRDALLNSGTWVQLAPNIVALLLFCIVLFPLSLYAFRRAVNLARRDGSLAHY